MIMSDFVILRWLSCGRCRGVLSPMPGAAAQRMLPCIFASMPSVARCRSNRSCVFLARMSSWSERAISLISVSREACMPNSICPRNSIFQRLPLNWGENIPRYFLSCSRVLNAIMLSFPMSVPLGGLFCPWHYTTPSKWNRLFAYFTSENASCPIESGMRPVSRVKNWGYSRVLFMI